MPGEGLGHFIGAMRIDAFRPAADFKSNMDLWLHRFRNATPASGHKQVYVAGDIERAMEKERMQKGIPLVGAVQNDLKALAEKMSLSFTI
jgi:LDH2 family malate/lactate/ureidoglycolate dehydrogenase